MKSKVLAIYLPQFHVIPENDEWWGNGFTEWTNVKRGRPFYRGHYQPRVPLNDDYYDLSDLKVLERHIKIARKAGIYGFCFYHYYFNGRKLLEKPIENYRDKSNLKFPYCLIWANQSWTRTWYRSTANGNTLLQQTYGQKDDWEKHFNYLLTFFEDERYIKVNNRPVYIIYIPQDIDCRNKMFKLWDKMAKEHGFDGIYLIAMNTSFGKDETRIRPYEAYMDFEPLYSMRLDTSWRRKLQIKRYEKRIKMPEGKRITNRLLANNEFSYNYLVKRAIKRFESSDKKTYAGVFPGWDNTARKDEDGSIVTGCSPQKFARTILRMLILSERQNKRFVFINAWNEWSEGAYLEPDKKYGYSYLKFLKRSIQKYEKISK